MKVLHLDSGRQMRGGQRQVLRLIEGLLARGVECRLLARQDSPLLDEARRREWDAAPLSAARAVFACRRADVAHAHDARTHTLAALAGGAPLIVSRRVAFPVRSRWKYGRAARYVAVSAHVADVLRESGVAEDKIAVVYDGVPLLAPAAVKRGVIAPANAADAMKGADLAVASATLAGIAIDFSDDLERDLPGAATLLYLTRSEGLGSAALLAMAAGAAVVASHIGGLPEIVQDGVTGFLVENHPPAIASALRRLAEDPDLAREMGARGRLRVAARFSIDRMVEDTVKVYRQVSE
jgi:glycosyltransferase involved in cell wall biosynthesis